MTVDARGLSMTGSGEAAQRYDQAIDHLIRFHPQVVDAGAAAVAVDQDCVLAKVFCAYLALMSTEEGAVAEARDALGGLHADDASAVLLPRERAHVAAAERWIDGDMSGAGDLLGAISVEYPRDLLALSVGHQIDFFTGDAVTLRDRIGRAIGGWRPDDSQLGFVQGMYAFGLEETNLYGQSEEVGQAAVERNPDDVWGIHAVVHTYEMAGRVPDGVRFMRSREADWQRGNFLNVHNSWHYALYLLQGGDTAGALAMYDRMIRHAGSQDAALELVDASALLWRMHLEGTPVGDRWRPLSAAWARVLRPGFYPFNDMHAVMSFIGNGELESAEDLVRELDDVVEPAVGGQHRLGDDRADRAARVQEHGPLRPRRVRPGDLRPAADQNPRAPVRRQSRPARRGRAHPARGRDQGRAVRPGRGAGQRAAVGSRVQHLRLVQAGLAHRRGRRSGRRSVRPGPRQRAGRPDPRRRQLAPLSRPLSRAPA